MLIRISHVPNCICRPHYKNIQRKIGRFSQFFWFLRDAWSVFSYKTAVPLRTGQNSKVPYIFGQPKDFLVVGFIRAKNLSFLAFPFSFSFGPTSFPSSKPCNLRILESRDCSLSLPSHPLCINRSRKSLKEVSTATSFFLEGRPLLGFWTWNAHWRLVCAYLHKEGD